jgi:Tubulin/FtsZ family, GTPase domain
MDYKVIGSGNTGMLLATKFCDKPLLFSTAKEDAVNFNSKYNVKIFSRDGASKRFKVGEDIWKENIENIKRELNGIRNEKVIMFSSLGGGSGSSSLLPFSNILLENKCEVLIFGVLPYKKEVNPPLANASQALNSLMPIISNVSVMLFDSEKLLKLYENDWDLVDSHIIKRADYIVNLLRKYNNNDFSPLTLDQSELDSVIFGGGFIDFSDSFLEERFPKFEYGNLDKTTKNCLVAMYIDSSVPEKKLDTYSKGFTEILKKVSGRVTNARLIPGILRARVNISNSEDPKIWDRAYITIASGLNMDNYIKKISKLRDSALVKAKKFSKEYKGKNFIREKSESILDI